MRLHWIGCRPQALLLAAVIASFAPFGAAVSAEEFVVGVQVPLGGSLARVGTGMSEGIQVATDVFNCKNGKPTRGSLRAIPSPSTTPRPNSQVRFPAARRRCLRWREA